MYKKHLPKAILSLFLVVGIISMHAEDITLTTYYPAPYGVYNELRSRRMAVGTNWFNAATFPYGGAGISNNATLAVEGNVAVVQPGQTVPFNPTATLYVSGPETRPIMTAGNGAYAHYPYDIAIGHRALADNNYSVAIGYRSQAAWMGGVAIGRNAIAAASDSVVLGTDAYSTGGAAAPAVSVGSSSSSRNFSVSVGPQAYSDITGTAVGYTSNAATSGVALGGFATAAQEATALGVSAAAEGADSMAMGYIAAAAATNSVAVGPYSSASNIGTVALGSQATAGGDSSVAIGDGARINSIMPGISIGYQSLATGVFPIAFGYQARATDSGTALGAYTVADLTGSTAVGYRANALNQSVAIGFGASAYSPQSIGIGVNTISGASGSVALGHGAVASGLGSVALGMGSSVTGQNSAHLRLGAGGTVTSANTFAITGGQLAVNTTTAGAFNLWVQGSAVVTDQMNIGTGLSVGGSVSIANSLNVSGGQTIGASLSVGGSIYAVGTISNSSMRTKNYIHYLTPQQYQAILGKVNSAKIATYKWRPSVNSDHNETHMGVMAEEAPEEIVTPDRTGINHSDYLGFLFAAIKAQQMQFEELKNTLMSEIDSQKKEIEKLKKAIKH